MAFSESLKGRSEHFKPEADADQDRRYDEHRHVDRKPPSYARCRQVYYPSPLFE
jgi:hypothetical protein